MDSSFQLTLTWTKDLLVSLGKDFFILLVKAYMLAVGDYAGLYGFYSGSV